MCAPLLTYPFAERNNGWITSVNCETADGVPPGPQWC
jgi:hypothetical protein